MGSAIGGWLVYVALLYNTSGTYEIKINPLLNSNTLNECVTMVQKEEISFVQGLMIYLDNNKSKPYSLLEMGCVVKERFEKNNRDRVRVHQYIKFNENELNWKIT